MEITLESLKKQLKNILDDEKAFSSQFILIFKNDGKFEFKTAYLEDDKINELSSLFKQNIYDNIINNSDIELCSLKNDDERKNAIYLYDANEVETIKKLKEFNIELDKKNQKNNLDEYKNNLYYFDDFDFSKLYGYLINIGSENNRIGLFKKHNNISLIKRSTYLLGKVKDKKKFELIKDKDLIKLNDNVQIIFINNKIYVLDINLLENHMGFLEEIQKSAIISIEKIHNLNLLEDIQVLKDLLPDKAYAKKLAKLINSSVIFNSNVSKDKLLNYSKNSHFKGKFKYTLNGKAFRLDTKKSKIDFLKLLNDSFLKSELTNQYYDVKTKDKLK